MHQARMGHHRQMEDMQEHKLTAAKPLATIMVLLGSKLLFVMQHVCTMPSVFATGFFVSGSGIYLHVNGQCKSSHL